MLVSLWGPMGMPETQELHKEHECWRPGKRSASDMKMVLLWVSFPAECEGCCAPFGRMGGDV